MNEDGLLVGGRTFCARCGVHVGGTRIMVVWIDGGWVCADKTICRWRRERSRSKKQLTFEAIWNVKAS